MEKIIQKKEVRPDLLKGFSAKQEKYLGKL